MQSSPVSSLNELEQRLSVPLDYPSPIGQEELVRNTANNILGFISQGGDATSTAFLISFLDNYYAPIIARGKGMSFGQDLYLMGAINETAYAHTGNPAYLAAAQKYYEEGVALGRTVRNRSTDFSMSIAQKEMLRAQPRSRKRL